jgi:mannose-6-phosphate isomerase-like protein (cupin superfamily)
MPIEHALTATASAPAGVNPIARTQRINAIKETAMQARILGPGQGRPLDILGIPMLEKATSDDLSGGAAVLVQTVPPAGGPPQHVHHETDEFFYVLEGELDVWVGHKRTKLVAGMSATLPRGIPHGFTNPAREPAKVLVVVTPGEGAAFFDDIDRERPVLPNEMAKLDAIVARHDLEFVE